MTIELTLEWHYIPWAITIVVTLWHVLGGLFGSYDEWKSLERLFRAFYWCCWVIPTWAIYFTAMGIHRALTT